MICAAATQLRAVKCLLYVLGVVSPVGLSGRLLVWPGSKIMILISETYDTGLGVSLLFALLLALSSGI